MADLDLQATSTALSGCVVVLEKPLQHGIGDLITLLNNHGAEWGANMSKKATHVVSDGWLKERRAFKLAGPYGVPVVREAWLHACIAAGKQVDVGDFLNDGGDVSAAGVAKKRQRLDDAAHDTLAAAEEKQEQQRGAGGAGGEVLRAGILRAREAASEKNPPRTKGAPGFPTIFLAELFEGGVPDIAHQRNGTLMGVLAQFVTDFVAEVPNLEAELGPRTNADKISVGRTKVEVPPFKETSVLPDRAACVTGMRAVVAAYDSAFGVAADASASAPSAPAAASGPRGTKRAAALDRAHKLGTVVWSEEDFLRAVGEG
jgi:ribosomal protein L12E/L44/L45/RPP1/RPP2